MSSNTPRPTNPLPILIALSTTLFFATSTPAQSPQSTEPAPHTADSLHQLNSSIETLVHRVSPAVIQILVTGYGTAETTEGGQNTAVIEHHRAIGSGVIVDPDGYIVTNAHVVNGAQTIDVIVPPHPQSAPAPDADDDDPNAQAKNYQARIIGIARDIDLAVIKIDAHDLPAISLKRAAARARQGELVFAFGSPEGLRNTVTMGVVSAVARQPDPDSPLVYVQTDTPINPGNSGGPLVDADGELVGINTFILSSSGGNQGLGFAIPAGVVVSAYPQLLKYGHVHHPSIGALVQTITPELASGLRLPRDFGVVVSDIVPGGPADSAGMKIQDVILTVDGSPTSTLPLFSLGLNLHRAGDHAKIVVLRGSAHVPLDITLIEKEHKEDSLAEKVDPVKNLVRPLNMLGLELTLDLAKELPDLRIPTGVIVAARTAGTRTSEIPLQTGDVIHGMNGTPITTLEGLRQALAKQKPGDAIALQIERYSQLFFVSFTR
jgi:serine protease Do